MHRWQPVKLRKTGCPDAYAALSVDQLILKAPRGYGISKQMVAPVISVRDFDDGNFRGIKAGCRAMVFAIAAESNYGRDLR